MLALLWLSILVTVVSHHVSFTHSEETWIRCLAAPRGGVLLALTFDLWAAQTVLVPPVVALHNPCGGR